MPDPLFILAPGRSYTSIISAMVGQHPQLHGILEMNLNVADSMQEWWLRFKSGRGPHSRGLLRTVAQFAFGEQTEESVDMAWHWLRQRLHWPTALLHRTSIETSRHAAWSRNPRSASTTIANSTGCSRRSRTRSSCIWSAIPEAPATRSSRPTGRASSLSWRFPKPFQHRPADGRYAAAMYELHKRILRFTEQLAPERTMRINGEDLLPIRRGICATSAHGSACATTKRRSTRCCIRSARRSPGSGRATRSAAPISAFWRAPSCVRSEEGRIAGRRAAGGPTAAASCPR